MEAIGASATASNHNEESQSQNQKAVVGSESSQSGTKKNAEASTTKLVEEDIKFCISIKGRSLYYSKFIYRCIICSSF